MSHPESTNGSADFVPPTIEDLNQRLPQFDFVELLGVGGMGAVYKARQPKLDRFVAIKMLPRIDDAEDQHGFAERFEREAQSMARLNHPHIVPVYDFGETDDGQLYFVMEFVEGADLHQLIHGGQLTSEHFYSWIPQVCSALTYAHRHGIVHRDIKPANILINLEGQVRVADFGLAKLTGNDDSGKPRSSLTQRTLSMGTPDYAAPEQIDADSEVDGRADIYSLGVVMYQMLTGKVPRGAFPMPSREVPGIDTRVDDVILQAMQATPADRYQNATEISTRLQEIQSGIEHAANNSDGTQTVKLTGKDLLVAAAVAPAPDPTDTPYAIPLKKDPSRSFSPVAVTLIALLLIATVVTLILKSAGDDEKHRKNASRIAEADSTSRQEIKTDEKNSAQPKVKPAPPAKSNADAKDKAKPKSSPPGKAPDKKPPAPTPTGKIAATPKAEPKTTPDNKPLLENQAKEKPFSQPRGPRRRMFEKGGTHKNITVGNLSIVSRTATPFDEQPLAKPPADLGNIARLAVGQPPDKHNDIGTFAIAQSTDGRLHSWGDNRFGQTDIPEAVLAIGPQIVQLSAGGTHALALDSEGRVYGWGRSGDDRDVIPDNLENIRQVVTGPNYSAALDANGRVFVWGAKDKLKPPADLPPVRTLAAGENNLLALHTDGSVSTWGDDKDTVANTPTGNNFTAVATAGPQHFALLESGQLLTWGKRAVNRPLPKITARDIYGCHDVLAIRLETGGWIFMGRDSRSTPVAPQNQRYHLRAAASEQLIFSWAFDPDKNTQIAQPTHRPSIGEGDQTNGENETEELALDPEAEAAIAEVQPRFEELYLELVETPFRESVSALNEFYVQYLEVDAGTAQTNAQLDELLAIQAEQQRIANGEALPEEDEPDTPAGLVTRRSIYRQTLQTYYDQRAVNEAGLNQLYLDKLDSLQADFTREGKTDAALAMRAFRERFAATRAAEGALEQLPEEAP